MEFSERVRILLKNIDKLKIINTFESNINNVTEKTKTELNNVLKFMGTESGDYIEIERYNTRIDSLKDE